jgi:hypothetical protein
MERNRLLDLFGDDMVGPSAGRLATVGPAGGGGEPRDAPRYFAGGYANNADQELEMLNAGGPSGYLMAGGARVTRRNRTIRRRKGSRSAHRSTQRGGKRQTTRGGRKPAFRLNLRAQIRLRQ